MLFLYFSTQTTEWSLGTEWNDHLRDKKREIEKLDRLLMIVEMNLSKWDPQVAHTENAVNGNETNSTNVSKEGGGGEQLRELRREIG